MRANSVPVRPEMGAVKALLIVGQERSGNEKKVTQFYALA
jgi:hypothetical protein